MPFSLRRNRPMDNMISAALVLALGACSTIDQNNRVADWPELKIVEHKVSFDEVQDRCRAFVGWGQWPMACAEFYFHAATCRIYYAFDWTLQHERAHCLGYDHAGSDAMRRMWGEWKASK